MGRGGYEIGSVMVEVVETGGAVEVERVDEPGGGARTRSTSPSDGEEGIICLIDSKTLKIPLERPMLSFEASVGVEGGVTGRREEESRGWRSTSNLILISWFPFSFLSGPEKQISK